MYIRRTLIVQMGIVAVCVLALAQLLANFPYPSPLIKPLLPPNLRWPTQQIENWVESANFGSDYLEYFARDPERKVPTGQNIVSPADGLAIAVVKDGISYLIVRLSFWDVHVVRTPIAGVVKSIEQEGSYFQRKPDKDVKNESVFLRDKAAPVQQIVTLDTAQGEVRIRLITSYWASRLKVWVRDGQRLQKGERIGRILLGSTVVAEFPTTITYDVKPRQRVVGGETIIWRGEATP